MSSENSVSSSADLVKSLLSGNGIGSGTESPSNASEDNESVVQANDSTNLDDMFGEESSGDTPEDSQSKAPASAKGSSETPAKEVITVTDETGRKRKVEIDYSDRAAIKKAHEMANGARKWQAERDQALQSIKQVQERLAAREKDWNILEQAFQQGEEALIDLLRGKKGAYREQIQKEIQRAEFLRNASPEEKQALEAREYADRQARELEKIRKENEEFKKQVSTERETAEMRALESRVHPTFEKYRFADKLGDANDEHMFDEMLWNSALKRLEPYEEQGLDISPELVEKEFRAVATAIRKRIGNLAEKKASRTIDQKKQEATENVQSKVMNGYKSGSNSAREAKDLLNSGNLTGLMKQWGKYGKLFQK